MLLHPRSLDYRRTALFHTIIVEETVYAPARFTGWSRAFSSGGLLTALDITTRSLFSRLRSASCDGHHDSSHNNPEKKTPYYGRQQTPVFFFTRSCARGIHELLAHEHQHKKNRTNPSNSTRHKRSGEGDGYAFYCIGLAAAVLRSYDITSFVKQNKNACRRVPLFFQLRALEAFRKGEGSAGRRRSRRGACSVISSVLPPPRARQVRSTCPLQSKRILTVSRQRRR